MYCARPSNPMLIVAEAATHHEAKVIVRLAEIVGVHPVIAKAVDMLKKRTLSMVESADISGAS